MDANSTTNSDYLMLNVSIHAPVMDANKVKEPTLWESHEEMVKGSV